MTKHRLEITLGLVRKANLQGRLYPVPEPGDERKALNFLVRSKAVIAVLGTDTSAAGYVAVAKPANSGHGADPVRKVHPSLKVGRA